MSEVFLQIVNMSISASWLVLAVLLLRLILKAAPKWVSVLLWGFVAVRLICPISIESALSLIPSAEPIPEQVIANLVVDVPAEIPGLDAPIQDQTDSPVRDETGGQHIADVTEPEKHSIPVVTMLAAVWAAGVGAMLAYTAVSYFLLRRQVNTAVRFRDNIYQSENVDSPFVLGVVKPRIYLPFRMDGRDLAHVIAHEQAHIRRKDHWWKPFGFVLLALHWFNPLIWAGYILLCRDIELACDEKVIKEMDNQTKADYTEALVACSVNRRRIAACPLAFGEVGVKERVKTVMNYKKPAFWIVIAAVALCIVVAVSFLTNPKDYGPEVGNPKLLEFPGVQWFVTPDELREALNITEDQIVSEKTDNATGGDTYTLSVKNLTLFGKEVTYAQFQFRRYPGFDFAFDFAVVMFDEDTDMVKLKEEVSEIYGPAADANDTYYIYYTDEKTEHKFTSRVEASLEFFAERGPEIYDFENNPWQEALDDPDYMNHHWVPKNGLTVIPKEVVEWFQYTLDQPQNADNPLQDDDMLMEWLDQIPWFMITLSNRCAATITRDARGVADDQSSSRYYTNNYMEFNAMNLWNYYFASQDTDNDAAEENIQSVPAPEVDDPTMLELPGIKWGATVEEVKQALNVTDEQIISDQAHGDNTWALWVTDVNMFGEEVAYANLIFMNFPWHEEYGLCDVQLYYPDETDMTIIKDMLVELYGEPKDGLGFTRYKVSQGLVESYTDSGTNLASYEGQSTRMINWWESSAKRADVLPADVMDAMIESGIIDLTGNAVDTSDPSSREAALECLKKDPAVFLYCTDSSSAGTLGVAHYTKNVVHFDATEYMWQLLRYSE